MNQANIAAMDLPTLMSVTPKPDAPEIFVGQPESYGAIGIYGGHFVGQALAAGFKTISDDKLAQSLHCYFLKGGNPKEPIEYHVEKLRDGRTSSTRAITGFQAGEKVFHMIAAFKLPEDGESHQKTAPPVISPEALSKQREQEGTRFKPPMLVEDRAELLLISDHFVPEKFEHGREPELQSWMRSTHKGDISAQSAQCVIAFLSDGFLMFNSVLPYGIPFQSHRLTSLDHSVWFHRTCPAEEWMLYDQRSIAAVDGRGLNEGEIFNSCGLLVCSTKQESMLRKI
ncbi:MAG: acyl-CoA thioesterase-2 [Candidatus Azotimanducaceae bacterium]|jgi:acyl-CoA thioesterase-2